MIFSIRIDSDFGTEGGESLWGRIKKYEKVNLIVLFGETLVYGNTSETIVKDVVYQCALTGKPIQLNIVKTPSE